MVILVNVPIDTGQKLIVFDAAGEVISRASVVAVLLLNKLRDGLHVAQLSARCVRRLIPFLVPIRCRTPVGRYALGIVTLIVNKKEKLILDNGTTQCKTVGLTGIWIGVSQVATVHLVAVEEFLLVRIVHVGRTLERVRTRLCDSIDTTTDEVRLTHVKWSNHHLYFVDGIHRHGISTTREVGRQAEVIV